MDEIILVHGYNHKPGCEKHGPARKGGHFDQWEQGVFQGFNCIRFSWDSALNFNLSDMFRAWRNGYRTTYGLAYGKLSKEAGVRLAGNVADGLVVFSHSLGTKVAIDALTRRPGMFKRVIFCNGAVLVKDALPAIRNNPTVEFLNIACREDDTLSKLGGNFAGSRGDCIGNGLVQAALPANMQQVILDDKPTKAMFAEKGFDIRGDDPDDYGDHSFSFEHPGNWPLFTQFVTSGTLP